MQNNSSQPKQSNHGAASLLGLWVVCCVAGAILAYLGYSISRSDSLVQWEIFAPAPPEAVEVMEGDPYGVKIRTTSGEILGRNYNEQIWVPALLLEDVSIEACDQYPQALKASTHPPEELLDCAAFHGIEVEYAYTVLYAIDQQESVWLWKKTGGGMEILAIGLFVLVGGGVGVLAGSLIWAARRTRVEETLQVPPVEEPAAPGEAEEPASEQIPGEVPASEEPESEEAESEQPAAPGEAAEVPGVSATMPGGSRRSNLVWVLAALPFVLVLAWAVIRSLPRRTGHSEEYNARNTAVYASINPRLTEEAAWYFAPPATPDPAGPAYDFVAQCQASKWEEWSNGWDCSGVYGTGVCSIDVTEVADPVSGTISQAVRVFLPLDHGWVTGMFPVWQIRAGDHIRAVLACPPDVDSCSLEYSWHLQEYRGSHTPLGTWAVTADHPNAEIDVDLSHFAEQVVSFVLWVQNTDPVGREQTALIINPRIESVP